MSNYFFFYRLLYPFFIHDFKKRYQICPLFKYFISLYNLVLYTVLFCYLTHLLIFLLVMVNIKSPPWCKPLVSVQPRDACSTACSDPLQIKVQQQMRINKKFHSSLILLKYFSFYLWNNVKHIFNTIAVYSGFNCEALKSINNQHPYFLWKERKSQTSENVILWNLWSDYPMGQAPTVAVLQWPFANQTSIYWATN